MYSETDLQRATIELIISWQYNNIYNPLYSGDFDNYFFHFKILRLWEYFEFQREIVDPMSPDLQVEIVVIISVNDILHLYASVDNI